MLRSDGAAESTHNSAMLILITNERAARGGH